MNDHTRVGPIPKGVEPLAGRPKGRTLGLERRIVNINEYDLTGTADEYLEAIGALAARTEREGHPGVLAYQFYVNRAESTAGATIVYEDAEAWVAHHELAYQWEEMPTLQATVSLKRLTLLGPLNKAMRQWISRAGFSFTHYDTLAAGFVRANLA
jgi:hypothetical protein